MKFTNKYLIIASLLVHLIFVGCSSDDDHSSSSNTFEENEDFSNYTVSGDVSAIVDGGKATMVYQKVTGEENFFVMRINFRGEDGDNDIVLMSSPINNEPIDLTLGSYTISTLGEVVEGNAMFYVAFTSNATSLVVSETASGQITFTDLSSTHAEGNFEFSMNGSSLIESDIDIQASDGVFKAIYSEVDIQI